MLSRLAPPSNPLQPGLVAIGPNETQIGSAFSRATNNNDYLLRALARPSKTVNLTNPLLNYGEYVPYDKIKPEHGLPAVQEALRRADEELDKLFELLPLSETKADGVLTFDNTVREILEIDERVDRISSPFFNLFYVHRSPEMKAVIEGDKEKGIPGVLELLVKFSQKLSDDPRIYALVMKYSQTAEAKSLTGFKRRHLDDVLKNFKYNGAELEAEKKDSYQKIDIELSELTMKFSNNLTESRSDLVIEDSAQLAGVPDTELKKLQQNAELMRNELVEALQKESHLSVDEALVKARERIPENSYLISDGPTVDAVMKYADNGELRKTLYFMQAQIASKFASRGVFDVIGKDTRSLDNTELMQRIVELRTEQAKLVDCSTHADLKLVDRMAKNPEEVIDFLESLAAKVKVKADQDYAELLSFQQQNGYRNTEQDSNKVCAWDSAYLSEKLRLAKYDLDSREVEKYLPFESVFRSLLRFASRTYGVKFVHNREAGTWDKDVIVFDVFDTRSKKKLGSFYLDAFERPPYKDATGAYALTTRSRSQNKDGKINLPQVTLVCNASRPDANTPSLMKHEDVVTLFHEFGHGLHVLLSKAELSSQSGTRVLRDFVEVPSQFHENFAWNNELLKQMAKHYQTGKPIPNAMITKMLKAKNFNQGLFYIKQLVLGLLDMKLYTQANLQQSAMEIYKNLQNQYNPFGYTPGNHFPNSFKHIFAGGYSAGYYSYMWSEVLDADLFSKFQEEGVFNSRLGRKIRRDIWSKGDTEHPMELMQKFLGRKPNNEAFLKRMGLSQKP